MTDDEPKGTVAPDAELGPGDLSTRGLPKARRGYEKKAVDALVASAVERWAELHRRHLELVAEIDKVGGADHLARELGAIGAEVGRILEAANDAATSLRDRSHQDAERLRSEAASDAETALTSATGEAGRIVSEAEQQTLELRGSAWEEATRLVESAAARAAEIVAAANEELLRLRGEGEREAHRRMATTRKDADDIVRSAKMEAERLLNVARTLAEEIIERAESLPDDESSATRKSRAIDEIDQLRAQHAIEEVSVLPAEPAPALPGGSDAGPDPARADLSDALVAEVERLREVADHPSTGRPDGEIRSPGDPGLREIGTLFEALRTTAEQDVVPARSSDGDDPLGTRDRRLLGIHNAAQREVKRRISDLEDQALDGVRGAGWTPSAEAFGADMATLLHPLVARAAASGAEAARTAVGVTGVTDPGVRVGALVSSMAADLASQLRAALSGSVGGPEETASTLGRVFRAWRTDDAERWVRMILTAAYNDAFLASVAAGDFDLVRGVPSGTPCRDCLGASAAEWDPASPPDDAGVPPVDPECRCGFEVVKK